MSIPSSSSIDLGPDFLRSRKSIAKSGNQSEEGIEFSLHLSNKLVNVKRAFDFPTSLTLSGSGDSLTHTAPRRVIAQLYAFATRLPWWGGLLSALAAYVLLHPISRLQMPTPIESLDVGAVALGQIFVFLANIGQFLLPLAFLVIAGVSGFNRWKHGDPRLPVAQDGVIDTSDAELMAGRQLAALIRDERGVEEGVELSIPPTRRHKVDLRTSQWRLPRIRAAKIVDTVGILATLGALWGTYEWFLKLPDSPEDTPWALLGADSDTEALRRRLQGFGRDGSTAKLLEEKQPLGQYRFGPPPGFLTEAAQEIPPQEEEPVEVYHSLRELETVFDAKYVPPPECYTYESNGLMVRCANHRIRARRAFIESGGKATATLLGSWEELPRVVRESPVQAWPQYDQGDWQQESVGDRGQGYGRDPEFDRRPVPPGRPGFGPQSGWGRQWAQGPAGEPNRDWQGERIYQPQQDRESNWQEASPPEGEDDWGRAWWSEPLPVEHRHWVDDL